MILSTLENHRIIESDAPEVAFDLSCDVLCVGAGSAGIYAADAAAREGADVILIEAGSNIGGMPVCGNVFGYYHGSRGGSHEEDLQSCLGDSVFLYNDRQYEQKQIHLYDRLKKSGVRLFCRHTPTGIFFEGNRAAGLRVFDGQREKNIRAGIIIDATSDGHLVRMCRVKKEYGRPIDGATVPFTVRIQYLNRGGIASDNDDSGCIDQYDCRDFSRGTIFAHASAARLLPAGEFINVAFHTGVREGLTFEGEESLRYSDILLQKRPEKILFWAYSDLDRHGYDRAIDEELFQNWWVVSNLATVTARIPVPMGSVVPRGIRGLVTAGRCLCCDTYSQSAVRMNRDMFRMGECVGRAAAMAVAQKTDFLSIDYEAYLARVQALGCYAGYADRAFGFDDSYRTYLNKMQARGCTPDPRYEGLSPWDSVYIPVTFDIRKNRHLLETKAPGAAIWSCYLCREQDDLHDSIFREMESASQPLHRYNCAIALGIMDDRRALPVLREIVERRDCFYFTDGRRSNQFRSAVAICLLGRLGEEEDIPLLEGILEDREFDRTMYHTLSPNYLYYPRSDRNFVYFDILTHACAALCKLYGRCGQNMSALHRKFADLFAGDKILRRITDGGPGEPTYEETKAFIRYMLRLTQAS